VVADMEEEEMVVVRLCDVTIAMRWVTSRATAQL
jgi:hypothetical protein